MSTCTSYSAVAGSGNEFTVQPDGPGVYRVRLEGTGWCRGQHDTRDTQVVVECNAPPEPRAVTRPRPDVVLDAERSDRLELGAW